MSKAWLSLGANIGDPPAQLAEAVRRIAAHQDITVVSQSAVLTTKPWGKTDQPDFANMAIAIETRLQPLELLDIVLGIERDMGRVRDEVWGPRLIDIDIIAYDRLEVKSPRLTLPHPHAHERSFVLDPLRQIDESVATWITSR
ncbi:MAG: 2-amino-4-hydroxy-6-hydroxymethyldihydropteridine diphosphokinase [Alphaproteobacteria bacterium]|jgi:2-amino-4-hydroxy-6-hydroxymethyldihydropteridine diphosphokinase|nr:2-amino-4-hydroxy-6-hydroxymethyldihydropteridine diphosphokinase [Alphaproteobacteria bacterium]MBU1561046.1 2-amino-4-hydroxy-6-hydroxymethyldihydropteridine diphosphokinase [Alphaproteobacteria bacterium]MBU2305020.1 2-amino-4-hydroxy-6-hydroxymethyldihydropteridine diphosphokinase [Alphaproteobacteria bacterium]MBU2370272.1 2-amino-4-hydroxy-6-hydroxymethyldihydropteridine diphosphokinase [Alphaproteobacteria bacterium]